MNKPEFTSTSKNIAVEKEQLIDRTKDLEALKISVDAASKNNGSFVLLYGETGVGKTKLAEELCAYARLHGMQILNGTSSTLFGKASLSPFGLWKKVIKDYLNNYTVEQLHKALGQYPNEISKLLPEITQIMKFSEFPPLKPELERDRLFEAVSQLIANICKTKPSIIVLDDLHLADSSSLSLLKYIARGIDEQGLLVLGLYCDTKIKQKNPFHTFLTELEKENIFHSIKLRGISREQITELIEQDIDPNDVQKEFCDRVYEQTKGNPLFVKQLIAMLKEEYAQSQEYESKIRETGIDLPRDMTEVLKRRFSKLNEDCLNILTMASFVGKDFTLETIEKITGIEEKELREIAKNLIRKGLLKHLSNHGSDMYSFANVLFRDIIYEEVNPLKRRKIHGIVGSTFEKLYATMTDSHFYELSSHYFKSGHKEKATVFSLRAGEQAERIHADVEASSYYECALELLREKENDIQGIARILEKLGRVKQNVGEHEACLTYWREAALLWEQLGEKENVAKLYRKIAHKLYTEKNEQDKAEEYIDKALAIFITLPEKPELASLYVDKANICCDSDTPKATRLIRQALSIAEKLNAYETIAESYLVMGKTLGKLEHDKANEYFEKALKVALENRCGEVAVEAYISLAEHYVCPNEREKRLAVTQKGYSYAREIGAIKAQSVIGIILSDLLLDIGDMDRAFAVAEKSADLNRKIGNEHRLALSFINLGRIHLVCGELEKGEKFFQKALKIARQKDDISTINRIFLQIGLLYFEKEEYSKARGILEKAGANAWQRTFLPLVFLTSVELKELDIAESQMENLQHLAQSLKDPELFACVDAIKGRLFLAQRRFREAVECYERSYNAYDTLGTRRWSVYEFAKRVLSGYAQACLERNQEGDREKALDLLNQALELFEKMNAKRDVEKTKEKIVYVETGQKLPRESNGPVATGHAILDELLLGGIHAGNAIVLTSPSCDEKDSLIKDFLETGAKNREITFLLTVDPWAAGSILQEFPSTFFLFVCNSQAKAIIKDKKNVFILNGVEDLTNIDIALVSAIRKLEPSQVPRRICIGLISDVLLQHGPIVARKWLNELLMRLRSFRFTTLALANPKMHPSEHFHAVLSLFDGEISIREARTTRGLTRFLSVKRMSNQKYQLEEKALETR